MSDKKCVKTNADPISVTSSVGVNNLDPDTYPERWKHRNGLSSLWTTKVISMTGVFLAKKQLGTRLP